MISLIDALDGIVGIEPEPELQPEQERGQILESAGSALTLEQEHQPEWEPEAIDAITVSELEAIPKPEPQPVLESTVSEVEVITVPDTPPMLGQIAEPTETDSVPDSEPQFATKTDDDEAEPRLTEEINILWRDHVRLSTHHKTTDAELRKIRAALAERLYRAKAILSRPDAGRGGKWKSWLQARGIPRSTADRLVSRYAETLDNENEKVPSGTINDGEDAVEKLAHSLLPRLKRTLPDTQSVLKFIAAVGEGFGLESEIIEDCVLVSEPEPDENESAVAVNDELEEESGGANFPDVDATSLEQLLAVAACA